MHTPFCQQHVVFYSSVERPEQLSTDHLFEFAYSYFGDTPTFLCISDIRSALQEIPCPFWSLWSQDSAQSRHGSYEINCEWKLPWLHLDARLEEFRKGASARTRTRGPSHQDGRCSGLHPTVRRATWYSENSLDCNQSYLGTHFERGLHTRVPYSAGL
jgi:hypothetical protein